jgi:hypothetical protein
MKKLTLVYPLLFNGSTWANNELMYSIRSAEKHIKNVDLKIVVISDMLPKQLSIDKVVFIYHKDDKSDPSKNILSKLFGHITHIESMADDNRFILMNDDFYFNHDIDGEELATTFYYDGTILKRWNNYEGNSPYSKGLLYSKDLLDNFALPTLNFAVHFPLPIYTKCLPYIKNLIVSDNQLHNNRPILFRLIYANYLKKYKNQILPSSILPSIKYTNKSDLKLNKMLNYKVFIQTIENQNLFSVGDDLLVDAGVRSMFSKLYPNKSMFES